MDNFYADFEEPLHDCEELGALSIFDDNDVLPVRKVCVVWLSVVWHQKMQLWINVEFKFLRLNF